MEKLSLRDEGRAKDPHLANMLRTCDKGVVVEETLPESSADGAVERFDAEP